MGICEFLSLFLAVLLLQGTVVLAMENSSVTIAPTVIQGDKSGICPSMEERETAIKNIQDVVNAHINYMSGIWNQVCGSGLWYRAVYINMRDPQQHCPTQWREYTRNSVRVCGRPTSSSSSCTSVTYSTGREYNSVCGRIIGYQVGSPDGFLTSKTIDQNYVDGFSVTYGTPRQHIWTFACGVTEKSNDHSSNNCPCWDATAKQPPSFVGNSYFCESANPTNGWTTTDVFYGSDKLWDGQQCADEGTCCTGPPWFSVQLPYNSTDNIEVRICGNECTDNEDSPLELLEIYIL